MQSPGCAQDVIIEFCRDSEHGSAAAVAIATSILTASRVIREKGFMSDDRSQQEADFDDRVVVALVELGWESLVMFVSECRHSSR